MPTIVLADDHNVVRHGLRALLEAEPDFRVIGEASDGLVRYVGMRGVCGHPLRWGILAHGDVEQAKR